MLQAVGAIGWCAARHAAIVTSCNRGVSSGDGARRLRVDGAATDKMRLTSDHTTRGGRVDEIVRMERANAGRTAERRFYSGFDLWGYGTDGNYDPAHDRAPLQRSPFRAADEP